MNPIAMILIKHSQTWKMLWNAQVRDKKTTPAIAEAAFPKSLHHPVAPAAKNQFRFNPTSRITTVTTDCFGTSMAKPLDAMSRTDRSMFFSADVS